MIIEKYLFCLDIVGETSLSFLTAVLLPVSGRRLGAQAEPQ